MSNVDYCNAVLAGLPQHERDRVQSVINAAARLSADARRYDHVTPLLMDLHWLRVPQRIQYKLSVLMYRCLNGAASQYLTELATPVGVTARRRLRSASSTDLVVPATRRASDRAFAVAGPRTWNSLSSAVFKKDLKSHLFGLVCMLMLILLIVTIVYFDYVQRSCSSLYRLPRFTNCPIYITLHYITIECVNSKASEFIAGSAREYSE